MSQGQKLKTKEAIKGEWSYEGKRYILSYTKRKPKENEIILSPEKLIREIISHDRPILMSIRKGEIKKDSLHLLSSTKSNLMRGEVIGSKEAILRKLYKIEKHFKDVDKIKYNVLDNLYMSVVESSQALCLKYNLPLVAPKKIPKELKKIKSIHQKKANEVIKTFKDYEHEKIPIPTGKELDKLDEKAQIFFKEAKNE